MEKCKHRLPCGWCDRKNERCEFENSITKLDYNKSDSYMLPLSLHCEHIWENIGISTVGTKYRCKVCGTIKNEPITNTTEIVARL